MASGDINYGANRVLTATGLQLGSFVIDLLTSTMRMTFVEVATGIAHAATIGDAAGSVSGFDLTGGVYTDGIARPAITGEYTKLVGIIFGAGGNNPNQRKTAATAALIADGVVTGVGTAV
jgi:hypothetical protein